MQREAHLWEALVPVVGMAVIIVYSMVVLELDPHMPIVLSTILAALMAAKTGLSWDRIRDGMLSSVFRAVEAMIIVMIVGMLIGSWMLCGTVPIMIYYGLDLISPRFFLPTGAILCAIVSIATGSSWSSSGTIGVALMGIGAGLGVNPAITAGMVVSGAYFGDKLSPLSDSTNLAAATAETNLYYHVKSMFYTTGPSMLIALVLYTIVGFSFGSTGADLHLIEEIQTALSNQFDLSLWLFLPPLVVFVTAVLKIPAIPSLIGAAAVGGVFAAIFQGSTLTEIMVVYLDGFEANTGVELVDTLINRGGVHSMMWTISLIIFALCFGGIMEEAGFTEVILKRVVSRFVKGETSLTAITLATGITSNFILTDQYLSIIVPGRMLYKKYDEMGLERYYLSRTLEDGGTLWSPMFPWNGCGAYQAATLGVPTFSYFPYAFLSLVNPFVSIAMAYLGIAVFRVGKSDPVKGKVEETPSEAVLN